MELILNAGLGAGVLMFLVLLFKPQKKNEDFFFLSWILVMLLQITFYNVTIFQNSLNGLVAIIGFALPLIGAPLLILYIKSLTSNKPNTLFIIIHLSTFVIYIIVLFLFQYYTNAKITAINSYLVIDSNLGFLNNLYAIPLAISGVFYGLYSLVLLKKHSIKITALFSFDENINLRWIQYMVYTFFVLILVSFFLIFGATQFHLFNLKDAFTFVGIALCLILVAFGYYGFRQTNVFSNNLHFELNEASNNLNPASSTYQKSGLTKEKIEQHAIQLTKYIEDEKPYLQENLNLLSLAEQCNLSPAQLSQVINQYFKVNFYDYINQYRVEEAKKMLLSSDFDHLSVLGIAFNCGFKSKSSFNRYFKKYVSYTPSEFKIKNQK